MHRYATAPRSTFEELFEHARSGTFKLDAATYPPVCGGRSGAVSLALGHTGAMIVHVEPGECRADEFRLKLLFETGTCVFSTPHELWSFWTGPVAEAFGIEPPAGAIVAPEPDPGDEDDARIDEVPGARPILDAHPVPSHVKPERSLTATDLAAELALVIHGQDAALERVASATVAQLRKRHPARPGSVVLLGPTGAGKTATVEALPGALRAVGYEGAGVFRLDCGELADSIQLTRLVGSPPGYSGHAATTPLLAALERPGCILLVDEFEKAHPDLLDLLLGLLDAGRLRSPTGENVDARHIVVALTTSVESEELLDDLGSTPLADRWAVQRACADHLRGVGIPPDLVGRIGAFAAYGDLDGDDARQGIAESAIAALAAEYGLVVGTVDPIVVEVVKDIANDSGDAAGARALQHAARELLAACFAKLAADGPPVRVTVDAGPPLAVRVIEPNPVADRGR
jgi:ATP-dependent Clp protease ATP-binding subunit ClpC